MQFTKRLHAPIRAGIITNTIRIWKSRRVKVGGEYRLGAGPGFVRVQAVKEISIEELTDQQAISSGFDGLQDLMKTAQHGTGKRVFVIQFEYNDGLGKP